MGKLFKKHIHSLNSGTTFLDSIKYKYNLRGWLIGSTASKFEMKLNYSSPQHGAVPQYNGNIAEMEYKGPYSGVKWFQYTYDGLNRLTNADYSAPNKELNEQIAYDLAGNITTLKRGPSTNTTTSYSYTNGNQLSAVSGAVNGSFSYDANGNATTDGTRQIESVSYNPLNLPATITKAAGVVGRYYYDASGNKLRSIQGLSGNAITRDYVSGIQYNGIGVIEFVATDEGRAVRNANGSYTYEYSFKDHLGNARVSIDDNGGGTVARVIQEDEYYAFGLNKTLLTSGNKNNYLYNGKEEQDALSDQYDYGARFYDPVIGRWQSVDPKAEDYYNLSSYNYGDNNPINNTDPDGRYVLYGAAAQQFFAQEQKKPYHRPKLTEQQKAQERKEALDAWQDSMIDLNRLSIKLAMVADLARSVPMSSLKYLSKINWFGSVAKSPSSLGFKELQKAAGSYSKEMNAFFNSKGFVVPSKEILKTYKELATRMITNSGGNTVRVTEEAIKFHEGRIKLIDAALKN